VYYFAYGSNMNWQQMQRRCPSSQFFCVACLPDYHFAIARHSQLRQCGTANIFPQAGREVWGIVYDVTDPDLIILDSYEDGYHRENIRVFRSGDGHHPIEVLTYIATKEDNAPLPNPEYKRLIVEGARHWNVPESYRLMLEEINVVTG
jgi:gamma-glutamylcyclotransferase